MPGRGCDEDDPHRACAGTGLHPLHDHYTEIIFTSCGTESDNAAIWSALLTNPERRKVVASRVEHPAILNLGRELERRGYIFETVPVDGNGRIDMAALEEAVDDNTAIVSVMYANNEIGNIYPVEEIAEIAHKHGALFHTDAVQAVGKVPIPPCLKLL